MNKKGFMRTVEAVLAVLFMAALYSQLMERAYMSETEFERNPSFTAQQVLDLADKLKLLDKSFLDFDISMLNSKIAQLMPAQLSFNAKIKYFTNIEVSSTEDKNDAVITFDYNFPSYVDTNSVRIILNNEELETKLSWNWYYIPLTIENDNSVEESSKASINNIVLKPKADKKSFVMFIGDAQVNTKVNSLDSNTASITFELPYLEPFEKEEARLYYADSNSLIDYGAQIIEGVPASLNSIKAGDSVKTKRATLLVKIPELKANVKKEITLSYSIGTDEKPSYNKNLEKQNYENVAVILNENSPKSGTAPLYSQVSEKNIFTVTKEFAGDELRTQVILQVWYKW